MENEQSKNILFSVNCYNALQEFINMSPANQLPEDKAMEYLSPMDYLKRETQFQNKPIKEILSNDNKLIHKYLKTVFRWSAANPNKLTSARRVIDTYYLPNATVNQKVDNGTIEFGNDIYSSNSNIKYNIDHALDHNRYLAVIGSRGSGKTAFINYWLTFNHADFENSRKTWFRFDVTKVARLRSVWPSSDGEKLRADIVDLYSLYFRAHTFFVIFSYGSYNNKVLERRLGNYEKSKVLGLLFSKLFDIDREFITPAWNSFMKIIADTAESINPESGADISERVVQRIVKLAISDPIWRHNLQRMAAILAKAVSELRLKVTIIFDGIDNIDWTKKNAFYKGSCLYFHDIWDQCNQDVGLGAKLLLVTREETLSEINSSLTRTRTPNTIGPDDFVKLYLRRYPISNVIEKKLDAALNSTSFEQEREELKLKGLMPKLIESINSLRAQIGVYESHLQKFFERKYKSRALLTNDEPWRGSREFIDIIFDGDVRAVLDTYIKAHNLYRFYLQDGHKPIIYTDRLIQCIFLNSRAFFHTELDGRDIRDGGRKMNDIGSVFPNIFWYKYQSTSSGSMVWHGLATCRLIKIGLMRNNFVLEELIVIMTDIFGYERSIIEEMVEAMVAYSIFDIDPFDIRDESQFKSSSKKYSSGEPKKIYSNVCRVTAKGVLYYNYVFVDPVLLYFLALDTPMASYYIEGESRYIRAPRNYDDLGHSSDFLSASVTTLAVFFQQIMQKHKEEKEMIQKIKSNSRKGLLLSGFLNRKSSYLLPLLKALELPSRWEVSLQFHVNRCFSKKVGSEVHTKRYNEIFGILNKNDR